MARVVFKGTKAELLAALRALPAALAGKATGRSMKGARNLARVVAESVGVEALSIVKEAFVVKSRHGQDEAGVRWDPLSPATVAYKRRHPKLQARRKYAKAAGRVRRPLLTAAQDRHWRRVFSACMHQNKSPGDSARIAWAAVKAMGGKTVLEEYGNSPHEIGRDTGRLLASIGPESPDCVLKASPGEVFVGTNVKYAAAFASRRPIFPARWPDRWAGRLAQTVVDAVAMAVGRAGP